MRITRHPVLSRAPRVASTLRLCGGPTCELIGDERVRAQQLARGRSLAERVVMSSGSRLGYTTIRSPGRGAATW